MFFQIQDNIPETNYWSILPNHEKAVICEKIGYNDNANSNEKLEIGKYTDEN